ncbi:hypothetical protein QLX08_005852 [Tetragonisca angustula]
MNTEHRRTIRVYLNPDNPAREQRFRGTVSEESLSAKVVAAGARTRFEEETNVMQTSELEAVAKVIQFFSARRALHASADANSNSELAGRSEPDISTGTPMN